MFTLAGYKRITFTGQGEIPGKEASRFTVDQFSQDSILVVGPSDHFMPPRQKKDHGQY